MPEVGIPNTYCSNSRIESPGLIQNSTLRERIRDIAKELVQLFEGRYGRRILRASICAHYQGSDILIGVFMGEEDVRMLRNHGRVQDLPEFMVKLVGIQVGKED